MNNAEDRHPQIPGPAGDDNIPVSLTGTQPLRFAESLHNQATDSAGGSKKSLCHSLKTCEAQNVTVEVLKITPSINGETSLLLKDAVGVMKASLTKQATSYLGSIHVGDILILNKVYIVASGHYNPVRLVCIDDTAVSSRHESSYQKLHDESRNTNNHDLYQFNESDTDQKSMPSSPKQFQNGTATQMDDLQTTSPPEDEIDALFDGLEDPF